MTALVTPIANPLADRRADRHRHRQRKDAVAHQLPQAWHSRHFWSTTNETSTHYVTRLLRQRHRPVRDDELRSAASQRCGSKRHALSRPPPHATSRSGETRFFDP